jgi:uncharacterized protein (TIGR02246 family)
MKRLAVSVLAITLARPAFAADRSSDESEIRKVEAGLQEAWNRHDARTFASLFTEDADCVNVLGWWWKGRREIEQKVADAHAFIFRDSVLTTNEIDVRFVTSQIALVHVRWSMIGQKADDGTPGPPRSGIETDVLQKQRGKWLVASFHNTNSVPERPFPTGPLKK